MSRNAERMRYQPDRLSHALCVLGIAFNAVHFVSIYRNADVAPDITIGVDILINIVFMMIVFLGGEKLKAYNNKWNAYMMALGAVQILRVYWIPQHFKRLEMLVGGKYTLAVVWLVVSGVLLILAGINSPINVGILRRSDGRIRVGE